MKITICGSVKFMDKLRVLKRALLKIGFEEVFLPIGMRDNNKIEGMSVLESGLRKIKRNLINTHYRKILASDCILVANYSKNWDENYIGGNTFLEMGFAFVNKKPIFVLNQLPKMPYSSEIIGMKPIVLEGSLNKIWNFMLKK